jgi:hypothetical protein
MEDLPIAVAEDDVNGPPHEKGVNLIRSFDDQRVPGGERFATHQPAGACVRSASPFDVFRQVLSCHRVGQDVGHVD